MNVITSNSTYQSIKATLSNKLDLPIVAAAIGVFATSILSLYYGGTQNPLPSCLLIGTAATLAYYAIDESKETPKPLKSDEDYLKEIDSDSNREVVFVVLPEADHNLSFSLSKTEPLLNLQRLAKIYRIEWVKTDNFSNVAKAMKKVDKMISHLIIAGHGSGNTIQLGTTTSKLIDKDKLKASDLPNLSPNANILLNSCLAGIPGGIGDRISTLFPSSTVYASNGLGYSDFTWTYLNSESKPEMIHLSFPAIHSNDPKRNKLLTRVIQNGKGDPLNVSKRKNELLALAREPRSNAFSHDDLSKLRSCVETSS